jgi:peptidoglycan glycosyltransferase
VNRQVTRLAIAALVLLIALIVGATYWQTWAVAGLQDRQDNAIQKVVQFQVKRGLIYASDGRTVLAANRVKKAGGKTFYFRRYPQRGLFAAAVGYSTITRSQAGLEKSENDYLTGSNTNLSTVLDKLRGGTVKGNNLVLSVSARAQRVATNALAGRCGAVVALEPATGRVLAFVSSPSYDPNLVEKHFAQLLKPPTACKGSAPLFNRATDGLFTPGSTFKVITAAAALDTGAFRSDSTFYDPGYCEEYGQRVSNAGDPEIGPETFGNVTLFVGLQHSINSVFCNIGKRIGAGTILRYAKRFGFYSVPPLETPLNERAPSGLYEKHDLFDPKKPETQVDPGRLAFGQERLLATPLQMAMVAATVANSGVVMRPHLLDRIESPAGKTIVSYKPEQLGRAIKAQTAAALTPMMVASVTGGTGTSAQISGISVAGKTGTAEVDRPCGPNQVWFIAFAPRENPRVAVAVTVECSSGTGGEVAGPIAKQVMQELLK